MEEDDLFAGVPPVAGADDLFAGVPPVAGVDDLFAGVPPVEEEDDSSFIGGVARGVVAAPVELARGVTELGALGLDAAFDTDFLDDVGAGFDAVENFIGAPDSGAGAVTRDLLVYGAGFIPIAGWLGRAGQVARGARQVSSNSGKFMRSAERFGATKEGRALLGNRAKVLGSTAIATGLYEGVVSPSGRSTLADSVDFLPNALRTETDTGLAGREEAFRQLRNRTRQAAEGSALSAFVDASLFTLGRGSRALGSAPVTGPALSSTARALQLGWNKMGEAVGMIPGAEAAKGTAVRLFSPGEGLEPAIRSALADVKGITAEKRAKIARALARYDAAERKVVKQSARLAGRKDMMQQIENDVLDYLDTPVGSRLETSYGPELQKSVDDLSASSGDLLDTLINLFEETVKEAPSVSAPGIPPDFIYRGARKEKAQEVLEILRESKNAEKTHLTRLYQLHQDPAALYKSLGGKDILENKIFKDAENLLTNIRSESAGPGFDQNVARESARRELLRMINIAPVVGDLTPANIERQIKMRLRQIKDDVLGEGSLVSPRKSPIFKLEQGIMQSREPLMEYPQIRALFGEITNPRERMAHMLDEMTTLSVGLEFYGQQARAAKPAASALKEIDKGARPAYVYLPGTARSANPEADFAELGIAINSPGGTTQDIQKQAAEELRRRGYVQLGEEKLDSLVGGTYGDLSGMFVPKELYNSITAPMQLNMNPVSQVGAILSQMKGLTQKMTIVPNIASRARDFIGTSLMTVASGNSHEGFGLTNAEGLQTVFRTVQNLDQDGTEVLAHKLYRSGVTDSNVLLRQVQGMRQTGPEFGAPKAVRRITEALETKTPILSPIINFFEKVTGATDAIGKARVLLSEEAKLREAFDTVATNADERNALAQYMLRSNLAERTSSEVGAPAVPPGAGRRVVGEEDVPPRLTFGGRPLEPEEIIAADRTRKVMPSYDELGTLVRETDRLLPIGTFTSFASENIRNMGNILELGVKELAAVVDDDLIAELGSRERAEQFVRMIRGHGSQRLTGLLTVAQIVPKAMVRAGQDATGMTDEQMDRLYEETDYFQKGQDLVPIEFSGDGKLKYINLSYTAPYSFVTDSVQAALRGYRERGRLDQNEVQQITGGAFDFIRTISDPFASESIFFERVRDALPAAGPQSMLIGRGGVTSTGAPVWNESDPLGSKLSQGFLHVVDSMIPAMAKLAVSFDKGEVKPGRLTRAMLDVPGERGQEFTVAEEIGRQITGFTPMEIDLQRDFEFAGKAYAPRRSTAKQAANRMIRRSDSTAEDIVGAWDNYLDSLYREQSRLYNDIESARTLGLSEAQIRRNLVQKANLGTAEVNSIMRGEFWPGLASREIREEVIRQVAQEDRPRITRDVPWSELNLRSNERRRQVLAPEMFRRRRQQAEEAGSAEALVGGNDLFAGVPEVQGQQAPAAAPILPPAPAAAPAAPQVPAIQTAPGQAPPAELLGSNPLDQLRNLQIVNRGQ